jgi:hypothetical protein
LDHHEIFCSPLAAASLKIYGRQTTVELSMKNKCIGGDYLRLSVIKGLLPYLLDRQGAYRRASPAQPGRYKK